jgi:serine protease
MNQTTRVAGTLLAACVSAAASAAELRTVGAPIAGQYIVVFKREALHGADAQTRGPSAVDLTAELANRHGLQADLAFEHALQGFVASASERQLNALLKDPRIDFIEQDGVISIDATQPGPSWGLDRADQRNLPLDAGYTYTTTAANVRAYIIDTGIHASHADFGGRVGGGYTAILDGRGTADCNGHGTHVAGTVGGANWGVAKGVRLVPVRVLGCTGTGTTSGVLAGIDWVTANHVKPAVANMSLGGGASTALDVAVQNSIAAGVSYVVAAGNNGANACAYSPARVADAITVGATTSTDSRASFSNYGTCLDLFAPGQFIASAWHTSNGASNSISGTSMAAPHVAGAAAIFLSANPGATPAAVAAALIANATPNKVIGTGAGSANRLLFIAAGGTAPPDAAPIAAFTWSCTYLACSFNGGGSTDDIGISSYGWNFGDGATASGSLATRSFAAAGTYSVSLTVRDTANQASTRVHAVTVTAPPNLPPTARFSWSCSGLTCTFNGAGSSDDQGIASYAWSFGDGSTGSGVSTSRTFAAYANYSVSLTVRDGANQAHTHTAVVTTVSAASAPCTNCTLFAGTLGARGAAQYAPGAGGYASTTTGTHVGYLVGPAGADFNLVLERWNGANWIIVATGYSSAANETVRFHAGPGTFRWRADAVRGSGPFQVWMVRP